MLYNSQLDTLIRVADSGSFRQAAAQLEISPSAVLKQIALLEKSSGVTIFERSRNGVVLTKAGESLYRDAKLIIAFCNDAETRARKID